MIGKVKMMISAFPVLARAIRHSNQIIERQTKASDDKATNHRFLSKSYGG
jgi:hypothetical protein